MSTQPVRAVETDESTGPVCGAEYPLIEPGEYRLRCLTAKIYRHPGLPDKPWKCQLEFADGFGELRIFAFFHLGTGLKPHAGRASRYWAAWIVANGGPARRRQVMSSRVFKDKWFKVLVETISSTRRGKVVEQLPPDMHYSIVRELLSLEAQ